MRVVRHHTNLARSDTIPSFSPGMHGHGGAKDWAE